LAHGLWIRAMPGLTHLKFSHPFFEVVNTFLRLPYLRIETLLNLRVGGLTHGVCRVDYDLFPLYFPINLINEIIVIHLAELRA
jgi:hypothetical protein